MTSDRALLGTLREERGSVLVVAGMMTLAVVLLATVVLEVGHVMEHRRHLQVQVDAAALAAGQEFPLCTTAPDTAFGAMSDVATQYGGFGGAGSFNQQVGTGGAGGTVAHAYQSRDYPAGSHAPDPDDIFGADTTTLTCGTGAADSTKMFDVKATETGVHSIFNFGISSTVNAHARVELKAVNEAKGLLPLAVPDVRPRYIFAKFVAESGTVSCTDPSGVAVASCEEELVKGTTSGNQQTWVPGPNQQLKVTVPTGVLGVRIRLVGGSDPNAPCGQLYVECYDASTANGLIYVRGWANSAAPVAKDVILLAGTCSPDASFTTADCSAGLQADVDLNATVTGNTKVWATVDNTATKYQLTPATTGSSGTIRWTLASGIPITGGGPHTIQLVYSVSGTGNGTSFGTVQRAFESDADSGPLNLVQVFEDNMAAGPYSYQGGTKHSLGVTVQTLGNLLLSAPMDPAINLRVFKSVAGNASQDQSIDCDPALKNFKQELATGCSPWYKTQSALTCPFGSQQALWGSTQPWTCAATEQGDKGGLLGAGLNLRIFGKEKPKASDCTEPNKVHWIRNVGFNELDHPEDKRVLPLFVTPLGTFGGSGNDVVPLIDFGYFYVTGYEGDPCQDPKLDSNADIVAKGSGSNAVVLGHFIKFFPNDNRRPSDDNCDLQSITPCVGVLTR